MAATYPADTFQEGVDLTIEASNQLAQVVRGDANTEVMVADGSTIPSIRKAQADSMYFKEPELWTTGQTETDYLQLKKYINPTTGKESWWFAKGALVSNPIAMGTSPFGDDNWTLYTPEDLFISGKAEYESVYQALKGKAAEAGYNLVRGSFEEGGTLTNTNNVLWYQANGKYYSWSGTFPKVVSAGSTPATSGGIGAGAWIDRTDVVLRDKLALDNGAGMVGTSDGRTVQERLDNIEAAAESVKPYVDGALSDLSTAANKFYPTLAEANADIANINVNQPVTVGEAVNGGLWYKATVGATTLTKSAYDPKTQAVAESKVYTDTQAEKVGAKSFLNLINPAQETAQGYPNSSGAPNGNTGYKMYLDYIPATANQKLWFKRVSGGTVLALYKADKAYISTVSITGTTTTTLPNNANIAFVRIATNNTDVVAGRTNVVLGYGDAAPIGEPVYNVELIEVANAAFIKDMVTKVASSTEVKSVADASAISAVKTQINIYENLVNPSQETAAGYLVSGKPNGTAGYTTGLDYYPVKPNQQLWFNGFSGAGYYIAYYDDQKRPSGSAHTSTLVNKILTIPATVDYGRIPAFMRICTAGDATMFTLGKISLGYANVLPTNIPAYGEKYSEPVDTFAAGIKNKISRTDNPLYGKKWVAIGDSITAYAKCYAYILAERAGVTLSKLAAGGGQVHRSAGTSAWIASEHYTEIAGAVVYNSTTQTWDKVDSAIPPDLITIAMGTNDIVNTDLELGVFSDRVNTTFYGALHVLISGLQSRFPNARIGYIAPIPGKGRRFLFDDNTNDAWRMYKAIRDVCAYYCVPVWNGMTEFGANPIDNTQFAKLYMPDQLHPNDAGHTWYANRVEDFIHILAK